MPKPLEEVVKLCPTGHGVQGCSRWTTFKVGCEGCSGNGCDFKMKLVMEASDYIIYVPTDSDIPTDRAERHERGHLDIDLKELRKTAVKYAEGSNSFKTKDECLKECNFVNSMVIKNYSTAPFSSHWWHDKTKWMQK